MSTDDEDHARGITVLYHIIGIIAQTFVYGIYCCLIPISTFIMLKKGLRTKIRKFLFGMTFFMWSISSVHWALSVLNLIQDVQMWFLNADPSVDSPYNYVPLFNAILLINYCLTDGVVVWRAWVLCIHENRIVLRIPILFLCCMSLTVTATIVIRIILDSEPSLTSLLSRAIDAAQVANLVFSLLTNISATLIVSVKAWKHRRFIKRELNSAQTKQNKAGRVLALLIESGVLYSFSGVVALVATIVHLPKGSLGDIYTPVNFQIAGIYPILVLILVNQESSFNKTVLLSANSQSSAPQSHEESDLATMRFNVAVTSHSSSIPDGWLNERGRPDILMTPSRLRFAAQSKSLPDAPMSPAKDANDLHSPM